MTAQVGINTDTPEQALDVNGKLAIGDDDEDPTEGTLRYNTTDLVFEGFDGTEWTRLTNEPNLSNGGSIPAGAIPVYGASPALTANDEVENITMYYGHGSGSFLSVPANTYLIITWASVIDNNISLASELVNTRIGPSTSGISYPVYNRSIIIAGDIATNIWTQSSLSPLVIVRPGERLSATNSRTSDETVNVQVRGFIVPNLNY